MIQSDPVKVATAREFHCNANCGTGAGEFHAVVRSKSYGKERKGGTMKAKLYVLAAAWLLPSRQLAPAMLNSTRCQ